MSEGLERPHKALEDWVSLCVPALAGHLWVCFQRSPASSAVPGELQLLSLFPSCAAPDQANAEAGGEKRGTDSAEGFMGVQTTCNLTIINN